MSDSAVFEQLCDALERASGFSRLEARGTVRLLLKQVGLDSKLLGKRAAVVAVDRFLEKELRSRGARDPVAIKTEVLRALEESVLVANEADSPESIFERITFRR